MGTPLSPTTALPHPQHAADDGTTESSLDPAESDADGADVLGRQRREPAAAALLRVVWVTWKMLPRHRQRHACAMAESEEPREPAWVPGLRCADCRRLGHSSSASTKCPRHPGAAPNTSVETLGSAGRSRWPTPPRIPEDARARGDEMRCEASATAPLSCAQRADTSADDNDEPLEDAKDVAVPEEDGTTVPNVFLDPVAEVIGCQEETLPSSSPACASKTERPPCRLRSWPSTTGGGL